LQEMEKIMKTRGLLLSSERGKWGKKRGFTPIPGGKTHLWVRPRHRVKKFAKRVGIVTKKKKGKNRGEGLASSNIEGNLHKVSERFEWGDFVLLEKGVKALTQKPETLGQNKKKKGPALEARPTRGTAALG